MKKILIILFVVLALVGFNNRNARADLILNPSADAYIDSFNPSDNFDDSGLIADYSNSPCTNTKSVYLRYNLSSLPIDVGPTTKIRVYLFLPPVTSGTLALWSTGDDWNGVGTGVGDETTLTFSNAPAPISQLVTNPSGTASAWVEFTGSNLSNYINAERNGDGVASFVVNWSTCVDPLSDLGVFEDRENTLGSGNEPELYPFSPTAITLDAFNASTNARSDFLWYSLGGLTLVLAGLFYWNRHVRNMRSST